MMVPPMNPPKSPVSTLTKIPASNYPEWEYKLWTDADNRTFLAEHYYNFQLTTPRWQDSIQIKRRSILAKSRNFLRLSRQYGDKLCLFK
jgi:hypothetical protein